MPEQKGFRYLEMEGILVGVWSDVLRIVGGEKPSYPNKARAFDELPEVPFFLGGVQQRVPPYASPLKVARTRIQNNFGM